jgi:hypothetical protein
LTESGEESLHRVYFERCRIKRRFFINFVYSRGN